MKVKASVQALKRIRELEMENEVLRRAAVYLSQANRSSQNAVWFSGAAPV